MILKFLILFCIGLCCADFCTKEYDCSSDNLYQIDGTCNNLDSPWLGSVNTPFKRLLPETYNNKKGSPRCKGVNGDKLPLPGFISSHVHSPKNVDGKVNMLAALFGQMITHDLTFSMKANATCTSTSINSNCMTISDQSDSTLTIPVIRTKSMRKKWDCTKAIREQVNGVTHWLDLSVIYGSDEESNRNLRTHKYGLLKTSHLKGFKRAHLPTSDSGTCSRSRLESTHCFYSGEPRVSINMILVGIQTLFLREHNRKARALRAKHKRWSDEMLFQEARRQLIAEYQHIIYNEWLPVILGNDVMKRFKLYPTRKSTIHYDSTRIPQISNEFATAAFRFGHSMLKSYFTKRDKKFKIIGNVSLAEISFDPSEAYINGGIDSLVFGALKDKASKTDAHFADDVHKRLFENLRKAPGLSLDALNLNRGRDHGLPSYNDARVMCGLVRAYSFSDLTNIPPDIVRKLERVYDNVDDIDLYTGGVSEYLIKGASVGQTFGCIIMRQFRDLKFGDRNFYESNSQRFKRRELKNIKKTSLRKLICLNMDADRVPLRAFQPVSKKNPLRKCKKSI